MEPNYFTCTLGQAAALGIRQPHRTINSFIDAQAKVHPHRPAVAFPLPGLSPDDEWTSLIFTFRDIQQGSAHFAARLRREHGETLLWSRQTVGLLCPSTPEFLFTWLGLMRLGHAVLLIAPQCPPTAIASLCEPCQVSLLLCHDVYQSQGREAAQLANEPGRRGLSVSGLPIAEAHGKASFIPDSPIIAEAGHVVDENDVAYLHHTSGTSSGIPKPIPQTHRAGVGVLPSFKDGYSAATFTTTPLYHGGIADLLRAWTSGALIWLFPGSKIPITASNIVKCLDTAHQATSQEDAAIPAVHYFSSVPYVLQMMEADPRGLQHLQAMHIVGVGGAALPDEIGNALVEKGVNLISRFGSAECGFLMSSHRDYAKDRAWQYLRSSVGAEHIAFQPADDGLYELVIKPGWPHMAKRNREDGSYATADLFAAHSSIAKAWRYHSRADSQLTLITGKKFDPAPLETAIATSELLEDMVVFGNGRPFAGALLFRSKKAEGLSDDALLSELWPAIEKLNGESQDHARISRAMSVPMPALEMPLEKSSKGTLLRSTVEKRFQKDMDVAYLKLESVDSGDAVPDEDLEEVIAEIIQSVVHRDRKPLKSTTDLFSFGVDSVAGMQIRHKLLRLVPQDAPRLPMNIVEDCGNAERLTKYLLRLRHGETDAQHPAVHEDEHTYMRQLVEDFSRFHDGPAVQHEQRALTNGVGKHVEDGEGEVVVLTGATGALGAHILDLYRLQKGVKRIYCLVRGADEHAAYQRVSQALVQRKLQPLGRGGSGGRVIILATRLGEPGLGLQQTIYDEIARSATIIMHVAWSVNFRMKLRSFVPDNIAGVRNLLNLALASPATKQPPHFAFCSSVASMMAYNNANGDPVPETIRSDPSTATGLGYSQSKWVAEQICLHASAHPRLRGRISIYRVGQLAGDTVHGIWNSKEAWPLMLSATRMTSSLPALKDEVLNWLPVDLAAVALVQGADRKRGEGEVGLAVYHVVNENERPTWTELLGWVQRLDERVKVVAPAEWVRLLEQAGTEKGEKHAALQLLDHWRQAFGSPKDEVGNGLTQEREKNNVLRFAMERTKLALPVLRHVEPVGDAYFEKLWKWVREMDNLDI